MRPIDADKVMEEINRIGGHNLCEWDTLGVKALICRQDTLDVVPREEVDCLNHILNSYALQYGTVKDQHAAIDRIKTETAREIFEEIEKKISSMEYNTNTARKTVKVEELKEQVNWVLHGVIPDMIVELKKKYTEDGK